ncbi:MAG: DNA-directed RNA polymerase subunit D [Thermoprotei archaeon]|nr:MAG: DNA-directed RNA polymerase subunit D [Thermoprotei archaeon]RLF19307.1 MAG: DNA-directed RNA polymerase subunit D [Thermoprotei archaeon]
MEVKLLEYDDNHVRFVLKGSNPAFANALRRIMIAEVPTLAIDEVVFLENTSILFDEIIAHRLALIPLKVDPEFIDAARHEPSKYEVRFYLDVEAKDSPLVVYSGDLKTDDPHVRPVSDLIPIVKLIPGQKLVLEAYARIGIGRDHAKWSPVSACAYKYMPIINIDHSRCSLCGNCVKYCPRQVLSMEKDRVVIKDPLACTLCKYCETVCPNDAIRVRGDDTTFIFNVESTGSLPPDFIVLEAAKILKEKCETFLKLLKEIREEHT